MRKFQKEGIISDNSFSQITDIRVENPDSILEIAEKRNCRSSFTVSGRLNIVAADHPARGSVAVGDNPFAMADRHELLARLVYVLQSEWVDGVLGSIDLLEELLILHEILEGDNQHFLDSKLMIASLNRAGHPGAVWELNDPITGTDAKMCKKLNLDAAKMLLRVDPRSDDSLQTLLACAEGVRAMSEAGLPLFLEPLPVRKENNRYVVIKDPDQLVKLASITSALGTTSRYTWLKLPFTNDFEKVAKSTTLPIVILGGDRSSDVGGLLTELDEALASGNQIRGAMYGRNVLFPLEADSLILSEAIGKLVHGKIELQEALGMLNKKSSK